MKIQTIVLTMLCMAMGAGGASGQYFLDYAGDTAPREICDATVLVTEAAQCIDTNHQLLTRVLIGASGRMIEVAKGDMPNAGCLELLGSVGAAVEDRMGARAMKRAAALRAGIRRLARVWECGEAEAKADELAARIEKDEWKEARAAAEAIASSLRIDPLQKCLDVAAARIADAQTAQRKGYGREAIAFLDQAADALRRAYLASRIAQARILVAHARGMLNRGSRRRASWTLSRAARKLRRGSYMVNGSQADAVTTTLADMARARELICGGDGGADMKLQEIEAKLVGLMATAGQ
ncbi:MAG: hypothetical protein NT045_02385 [Candidatus Aureabacteria bacterium]|nr:hypothetical protein [Candidatus Auribacterota bacterium]